ncbi:MAG TPA: DUF2934 domain-containing protein [Bryobacteraceae bacterium]|jgi:hypothetical protein|nr:DUF2934 domain-containing protein [Bryobacteraceae bacterium]
MPSKKLAIETAAATPERAAKPRTPKTTVSVKSATPRVRMAKHKAAAVEVETPSAPAPAVDRHDEIARIAYGFWEARGREHGHHVQDWLRAEQEYLLTA